MDCELCGKPATERAIVEGATLNVCIKCATFGNRLVAPKQPLVQKRVIPEAPMLTVVTNAGELVRQAREKLGMNHKDFALKLNEHQSVIHHVETGRTVSLELARKFEKHLHLKLVEESAPITISSSKTETAGFTIGDLLKK